MQILIEQIRERLQRSAYVNEAAISHGVVMPIINALGWDTADPQQVVPEFSISGGRVDFALFGLGHKPAVFIEVKQVGRAVAGDRQLFEYCFHQGVPLCVLTDGREWSFYLPAGLGSYEDRRVYRLQIDDREPAKCEQMLTRYLSRERVRDQTAFEDAQRDHRDAARRREATGILPLAWRELVADAHDQLLEAVTDKTEALCGYKPAQDEVIRFMRSLQPGEVVAPAARTTDARSSNRTEASKEGLRPAKGSSAKFENLKIPTPTNTTAPDKTVTYVLRGQQCTAANAGLALVEILRHVVAADVGRIPELARAVSGTKVNHIAQSPAEINPAKPELARAVEIAPGWSVGLNISNKTKMGIIRTACELYGLQMPEELDISLPNAA
jgi:predicted type IV restriction endonuclease